MLEVHNDKSIVKVYCLEVILDAKQNKNTNTLFQIQIFSKKAFVCKLCIVKLI